MKVIMTYTLEMHWIQNFWIWPEPDQIQRCWIPPDPDQIHRLWIRPDPDPTRLTTRMCIILLWWTCTKTEFWRFICDICSLVACTLECRVIFHVHSDITLAEKCWTSKTYVQYHWWKHFSTIHRSGRIRIQTGSTISTGYPTGSRSRSGAPLMHIVWFWLL